MAELGERIEDGKLVELKYRLLDAKTGQVLSAVEFPLNYIHGQSPRALLAAMQDPHAGHLAGREIRRVHLPPPGPAALGISHQPHAVAVAREDLDAHAQLGAHLQAHVSPSPATMPSRASSAKNPG